MINHNQSILANYILNILFLMSRTFSYNPLVHTGCLFNEELDIDNNFAPIWNQTTMSPCIDAGTGVNDPDGTPADIGAFELQITITGNIAFDLVKMIVVAPIIG